MNEQRTTINELNYKYAINSNRADQEHQAVCQQAQMLEWQGEELEILKEKIPALEISNKTLRSVNESQKTQIDQMRDQILKLESRWKTGAKEPYKLTAKTILEAMQLRSNNEISEFTLKKAKAMMNQIKKNNISIGVGTDLQDIKVNINVNYVATSQPRAESGIQVEPDTVE